MINQIKKIPAIKFSLEQLQTTLKEALPLWTFHPSSNRIHRSFKFKTFEQSTAFLTQISMRSHLMGHHPTIVNTYNQVDVFLATHDAGDGGAVTDADLKLAKRIDAYAMLYNGDKADASSNHEVINRKGTHSEIVKEVLVQAEK